MYIYDMIMYIYDIIFTWVFGADNKNIKIWGKSYKATFYQLSASFVYVATVRGAFRTRFHSWWIVIVTITSRIDCQTTFFSLHGFFSQWCHCKIFNTSTSFNYHWCYFYTLQFSVWLATHCASYLYSVKIIKK